MKRLLQFQNIFYCFAIVSFPLVNCLKKDTGAIQLLNAANAFFGSELLKIGQLPIGDTNVKNLSLDIVSQRSSGAKSATHESSWMPYILTTMKNSINYLGKSKQFGLGSPHGGDNGLTGVVCLLALVAIASFLLFLLQPMFLHPKRRMSRRLRGNPSPFSYKPISYWEGKSSEPRPIVVPGPLLQMSLPTVVESEEFNEYSVQKQTNKNKAKKIGLSTGKSYGTEVMEESVLVPGYGQPPEDKLTKEEIMYILKSLND